jgi:hypothetical protein
MPTHREQFFRRHGIPLSESLSLEQIARKAGVPVAALREVYRRGEGAYGNLGSVRLKDFSKNPNTAAHGRADRLSMPQWAYARVYSFVNKGTTYKTTDSDIARRYNY